MAQIILYDLPSKDPCACWSLNPWKTRLALNYLGLDYKTEWVEYPDVAPLMKSVGLEPNAEGTPYTIPAVRLPDGKYLMESRQIAAELVRYCPDPPLHLDAPELKEVEALIPKLMMALRPEVMPNIPRNLLKSPSAEYFERTRAERFGKTLGRLEREDGGEICWTAVEPAAKELGTILKAQGGPFVLGKTVSYADFVILGLLQFIKRINEDFYKRAISIEPSLGTLYDASTKWLERDDH